MGLVIIEFICGGLFISIPGPPAAGEVIPIPPNGDGDGIAPVAVLVLPTFAGSSGGGGGVGRLSTGGNGGGAMPGMVGILLPIEFETEAVPPITLPDSISKGLELE